MIEPAALWLYTLTVFGVIALPGMDMAYVLGSSIAGGRRVGIAAVAGIVVGGFCHMAIGATGIGVVLAFAPAAFAALLLAGAAYIAWIGIGLLRTRDVAAPGAGGGARTPARSFRGAVATCLLNPKAYVFMLAIFPQFVRVEHGSIWTQAAVLALITALVQVSVYGGVAIAAARATDALAAKPHAGRWMARAVGAMLVAAAVLTVWGGLAVRV